MNAKQNVPAASPPDARWMTGVRAAFSSWPCWPSCWNLYVIMRDTNRDAGYRELVSNVRVLSQQIEANAREAVDGDAAAFNNLERARAEFDRTLEDLANGTDDLPSPRELLADELAPIGETWSAVDPAAATIVARKDSIEFLSDTSATLAGPIEDVQKRTARIADVLAGSGATVRQVAHRRAPVAGWPSASRATLDRMLEGGSGATEAAEQFNGDTQRFAACSTACSRAASRWASGAGRRRRRCADAREVERTVPRHRSAASERMLDSAPDLKQARQAAEAIVQSAPSCSSATSVTSDRINNLEGERKLNMGSALAFGVLIVLALVMIGIQSTLDTRRRLAQTDRDQRAQPAGHPAPARRAGRPRRWRPHDQRDGHRGLHRRDRRRHQLHHRPAARAGVLDQPDLAQRLAGRGRHAGHRAAPRGGRRAPGAGDRRRLLGDQRDGDDHRPGSSNAAESAAVATARWRSRTPARAWCRTPSAAWT